MNEKVCADFRLILYIYFVLSKSKKAKIYTLNLWTTALTFRQKLYMLNFSKLFSTVKTKRNLYKHVAFE